jgi:molybdate transport repressor ModE-like protein
MKSDIDLHRVLADPASHSRSRLSNWSMLRTFHHIADQGSLTGAARVLAISQPSVSAALQRLEDVLGHQLIQRGKRRFALTTHGQILFTETQHMFRAVQRAEERMRIEGSSLTGQLRLQTVTGNGSDLFDEALRLMHQRHPAIGFDIDVASSHRIVRNVADQIVPFGACLMVRPAPGLTCKLILRSEYGIYCGQEHPLYGREDLSLSELRDESYIGFACSAEGDAPEPLITLRNSYGLGHNLRGTSPNFAEVVRMLVAGLGISILPVTTVQTRIRDEQLWRFPLGEVKLSADLYFISNPKANHAPVELAFLEVIDEVLAAAADTVIAV